MKSFKLHRYGLLSGLALLITISSVQVKPIFSSENSQIPTYSLSSQPQPDDQTFNISIQEIGKITKGSQLQDFTHQKWTDETLPTLLRNFIEVIGFPDIP